MMRPRLQFSLRFLLVVTAIVAAFFGGRAYQRSVDEPEWLYRAPPLEERSPGGYFVEHIRLADGTEWQRMVMNPEPEQPGKPVPTQSAPAKVPAPVPDE